MGTGKIMGPFQHGQSTFPVQAGEGIPALMPPLPRAITTPLPTMLLADLNQLRQVAGQGILNGLGGYPAGDEGRLPHILEYFQAPARRQHILQKTSGAIRIGGVFDQGVP